MGERRLTTEVPETELSLPLDHRRPILLLGSCFSQNISSRLNRAGFQPLVNPFGISFNPMSMAKSLRHVLDKKEIVQTDLGQRDGLHFHYDFHSSFSGLDEDRVLERMNASVRDAHEILPVISHLILTLGTAWVYRLKESGQVVNNCHKIPQDRFSKELLRKEEIVGALSASIDALKAVNPEMKVIMTLSPVRHWKDGAVENSLSKAILRTAIADLQSLNAVEYFPSYEIMMDELRDYRYYEADMLHPSELAQDIIWTRFMRAACDSGTLEIVQRVEKFRRLDAHMSLHPGSPEDLRYQDQLTKEREELRIRYPFLSLD